MTISADALETRLRTGLRNQWYAVLPSNQVTATPVSIYRCGFRIVLWRDHTGRAYALEDHCPHRGAPLSQGTPLGNKIACPYHGVQVDADDVAVKVPGAPGCRLEGMHATRSFPLEERGGAVFLFVGETKDTPPTPLRVPPELEDPEYSHFVCYTEWGGDYRYVIDNVMDPMHGTFLHHHSHSMSEGEATANFQIVETEHGFVFEKEGQRDVNFDWTEFIDIGSMWLKLEIPYPKTGGPGGNFMILGSCSPMQDGWSAVFFWRLRKVSGWQRDAWRFLYRNRLEGRHWHVLEQDRVLIEDYEPGANQREILYQHDAGLVRLRRYLKQKAEKQLETLAHA
ncbi:MAG: aromatic ring-hydroxylating dioxygenase subunit alpha [Acetobacter aceti]|uniref:3-phenylpropionate dioxygenase n=1 Tax=Acetobacter aceti TaxID=435 RepID=A0A1U9KIR9_ACEAC|nr:aromatic ring-hydroxylating dioxygenase subunit alpha [Acetobacter aceti]AQS85683.1 3-phenylpropionate dioxygenase [Acetobacter aceti]